MKKKIIAYGTSESKSPKKTAQEWNFNLSKERSRAIVLSDEKYLYKVTIERIDNDKKFNQFMKYLYGGRKS